MIILENLHNVKHFVENFEKAWGRELPAILGFETRDEMALGNTTRVSHLLECSRGNWTYTASHRGPQETGIPQEITPGEAVKIIAANLAAVNRELQELPWSQSAM